MHRKIQEYALCTIEMTENHAIRICISIFYFFAYQNKIFEQDFIQRDKNEKKHASQINRILNNMTSHVN